MCFLLHRQRSENPLEGLPTRQLEACALRFYGDGHGPLSERQVAFRLGVTHRAARKLIAKGAARLTANGYIPRQTAAQVA